MTYYIVMQTFETIGIPCRSCHDTRAEAEAEARALRSDLARMVAEWITPDHGGAHSPVGDSDEMAAWDHALTLSNGACLYGAAAGEYIAAQAVTIETGEDDDDGGYDG